MSGLLNFAYRKLKNQLEGNCENGNVGKSERILSVISGGFILGMGLKSVLRSPLTSMSGIGLGGMLIYRGVTGHCPVKETLEGEQPETTVIEHRYFVK